MAAGCLAGGTLAGKRGGPRNLPLPLATDPTGFPMIWVEAIAAWMHWLPVSKLQFERFLQVAPDRAFDAAWYDQLLALNPRVAPARIRTENYDNALLTGILPAEAERFAAWSGEGFAIPSLEQWLLAWSALKSLPAERGLPAAFSLRLEEPVHTLLLRIDNALAAATAGFGRRTLADQMLMRWGVLEWVEQAGHPARWAGIGQPLRLARGVQVSPDRGPVVPDHPEAFRSYLFGFRLIRQP
jgi:hypothetical protein